jgi:hypothetical protein
MSFLQFRFIKHVPWYIALKTSETPACSATPFVHVVV